MTFYDETLYARNEDEMDEYGDSGMEESMGDEYEDEEEEELTGAGASTGGGIGGGGGMGEPMGAPAAVPTPAKKKPSRAGAKKKAAGLSPQIVAT